LPAGGVLPRADVAGLGLAWVVLRDAGDPRLAEDPSSFELHPGSPCRHLRDSHLPGGRAGYCGDPLVEAANVRVVEHRYELSLQAAKPAADDTRTGLPREVQRLVGIHDEHVRVTTLDPDQGEVNEDTAAAAGRQVLGQRAGQGCLGEIRAAQLDVAGTALLGQPGAVEAKPATVVHRAAQLVHLLGRVERPLA